jgi:CRISPR-associated protein Cst1
MLRYTGHPLYDVGVATLAAFAGKSDPATLTEEDLDRAAQYMAREYVREPLLKFLTVAFPNSGFTQPAFKNAPERRKAYAERVLGSYRAGTPTATGQKCVFTGMPAVAVPLKEKDDIPPGRAFRQHVPLLTGEGIINFHPYGDAGLPVSGPAILALQALPLGCAKVGGRLLAVHSDNTDIIYHFASKFLEHNRKAIVLAQEAGSGKMPESPRSQRTLLVETLLEADRMQLEAQEGQPFSVTAYHLTNSGQGAALDIYHLPSQVVSFLAEMHRAQYRSQWQTIVARAWQLPPTGSRRKEPQDFQPKYNFLYEDLFGLPANARRFLRVYLLRTALRRAREMSDDPRGTYSLREEADLVSWPITERFLRRIMGMDRERVEAIRQLGDRLADYVARENDRQFFRGFYWEQRSYDNLRTVLLKANIAQVKRGGAPLFTFDDYLLVFEEGDDVARPDWRLARDLVLIRMVEKLHQQGWLGRNVESIPEEPLEESSS